MSSLPTPPDSHPSPPDAPLGGAGDLLAMARTLRSSRSTSEALRAVTITAHALTHSAQVTLRLVDTHGRGLVLAARTGMPMHRVGTGRFWMDGRSSLLAWCVAQQESALVNDVHGDERFLERAGQSWMPSGVLVAPLLKHDGVIGVLSAARHDGPDYEAQDLVTLELIAEMTAPYIMVALLSEQAEADPLTLLYNRRHLEKRFPLEVDLALSGEIGLSPYLDHLGLPFNAARRRRWRGSGPPGHR